MVLLTVGYQAVGMFVVARCTVLAGIIRSDQWMSRLELDNGGNHDTPFCALSHRRRSRDGIVYFEPLLRPDLMNGNGIVGIVGELPYMFSQFAL